MAWKALSVLVWLIWLAAVAGAILHYPRVEPGMQLLYVLFTAPFLAATLPILYMFTSVCFLDLKKVTDPSNFI